MKCDRAKKGIIFLTMGLGREEKEFLYVEEVDNRIFFKRKRKNIYGGKRN